MKKEVVLGLLLVVVLFISACEQIDISQLSDEDLDRIAKEVIVCNAPYIRFETGCCLDQNSNAVCDKDERVLTQEEKEKEDKINKETPSGILPPVEETPAEPIKSKRPKEDKLMCLDTFEESLRRYSIYASEEEILSLERETTDYDKEDLIELGLIEEGESLTIKMYQRLVWEIMDKEYKECKTIQDSNEKDACLRNAGSDLQNYCICEEIKNDNEINNYKRSSCYTSVGRGLLDIRICEKATALNFANDCSDGVYKTLARKNLDQSYCDKSSTQERTNICYQETYRPIAFAKRDLSFCDKINAVNDRNSCYWYLVQNFEEIDLCECNALLGNVARNILCIQQSASRRGLEFNDNVEDETCNKYVSPDWQLPPEFVGDHSFCIINGKSCGDIFISPAYGVSFMLKPEEQFLILLEDFKGYDYGFFETDCQIVATRDEYRYKTYCNANSLESFYSKILYSKGRLDDINYKEIRGEIYIKDINSITNNVTLNLPIS